MTTNETIDGLQEIIDRNQKTILPRVHVGYLIHAVKYLKEQKEEIENLKQTAQSMMEGICLLKEQETGHWISLENCSNSGVYCSECHTKVFDNYPFKKKFSYFCPHCGTRMEGEIERR